jgi:hypothetical protein
MAAKKERPAPAKAPRTSSRTNAEAAKANASEAAKAKASFSGYARAEVSPEEVRKLIAEAAYYRAKRRGFAPGHEIDDWVQAEAEVMRRIGADQSTR